MILVTGATGLVGSHLLYQLCRTEEKIRATKREHSNLEMVKTIFSYYTDKVDKLFNKIEWVDAELLDIVDLERAFKEVTEVYHCAAWISFNPKHKQKMIQNNVNSTANIVNLCLAYNIKKLCHVSSVAAIGRANDSNQIDETIDWVDGPENSNYAISKYQSELEVWRGIEEGLNAVIVNPSIILGPGNWKKGSASLFHRVWKGMPFYTTGTNGFIDVRDVVNIMIQLMNSHVKSKRFILCSESIPFQKTFNYIAEALGKAKPHIKVSPQINSVAWRVASVISFFTRKSPFLTKETALASSKISIYENDKIKKTLNYEFISVAQSCTDFSNLYLKDLKLN